MIRMSLVATGTALMLVASIPTPAAATPELYERFLIEHPLDGTCLTALPGLSDVWLQGNCDSQEGTVWRNPEGGEIQLETTGKSGGCLDVDVDKRVFLHASCTGSPSQTWQAGGGQISNDRFGDCLDGNVKAGEPVYLDPCNQTRFQHWRIQGLAR
ncbi:ricin-type beta-trefoil lectin domain protein [Streptomyces sp. CBMA123]|uniref:ricin-type beta-trefoil lectin domain protein n=1 Tax=Streptomyces sp. CBMA123 TaxID=1896313 RepID=UPI0016621728|nr:ricin-type beta-trefoil lectin domain protein [Streptomyces sp. CBMA123]